MSKETLCGGTVTVEQQGEQALVAEEAWYADVLRRLPDGRLIGHGRTLGDPDVKEWLSVSSDDGRTWESCRGEAEQRAGAAFLNERPDGSVIGWHGAWNSGPEYEGRPGQPAPQTILRAESWQALADGRHERIESTVSVPYLTPLVGDNARTLYTVAIWGGMVETEHGHLVQAAYPVLAYDQDPRRWPEHDVEAKQYRTCVIYSRDNGESWHYLATVASTAHHPLPAQAEGYCEPDLLYFGDGRLLCVMRSGGNPAGALMERYTSLVACDSEDGGLSWTAPRPIAAYGVKPILLRMQSGLVVCLAGRPGFFLLFSADEGRTWSRPLWLTESHGRWSKSASGYGTLTEIEPGVVGVLFDEYRGDEENGHAVTLFRRYRVSS